MKKAYKRCSTRSFGIRKSRGQPNRFRSLDLAGKRILIMACPVESGLGKTAIAR